MAPIHKSRSGLTGFFTSTGTSTPRKASYFAPKGVDRRTRTHPQHIHPVFQGFVHLVAVGDFDGRAQLASSTRRSQGSATGPLAPKRRAGYGVSIHLRGTGSTCRPAQARQRSFQVASNASTLFFGLRRAGTGDEERGNLLQTCYER